MGVLARGSSHAWLSAQPPIDTSGIFSAHVSAETSSLKKLKFWSNFSPNQAILSTFRFFQSKKKSGGGVKNFKIFVWYIFSPNQAILSNFRFFRFFQKNINCGHYVCLPSTKIVVTMFACHLHNSSGMCLHLARTNHMSAESPSKSPLTP